MISSTVRNGGQEQCSRLEDPLSWDYSRLDKTLNIEYRFDKTLNTKYIFIWRPPRRIRAYQHNRVVFTKRIKPA